MRSIHSKYTDPLDLVWLACAKAVGVTIMRSSQVYAAWDGRGTLLLGRPDDLDADDCLAQMLLHELCHALVMGEGADRVVDWGLPAEGDDLQEHATQRLQAKLADVYGLRGMLGVTTDHRPYWDALSADPLAEDVDPAVQLARAAFVRATEGPWAEPLAAALRATAAIAAIVRPLAPADSLWAQSPLP
jgi:hypothetical protein